MLVDILANNNDNVVLCSYALSHAEVYPHGGMCVHQVYCCVFGYLQISGELE